MEEDVSQASGSPRLHKEHTVYDGIHPPGEVVVHSVDVRELNGEESLWSQTQSPGKCGVSTQRILKDVPSAMNSSRYCGPIEKVIAVVSSCGEFTFTNTIVPVRSKDGTQTNRTPSVDDVPEEARTTSSLTVPEDVR